jgi:uncharacterized protein (DUF2062 family)
MTLPRIPLPFTWKDLLSKDGAISFARYMYQRFIQLRGSPEDIAWGMAIGLFMGLTPTVGIQTYMAIFVASLLKRSKISAAIGVWITNPVTIPFFYGLTYYIGAKMLGHPLQHSPVMNFSLEAFRAAGKSVFISLWVGGVLLGLVAAIIGYFLSLHMVLSGKKKAEELRKRRGKEDTLTNTTT